MLLNKSVTTSEKKTLQSTSKGVTFADFDIGFRLLHYYADFEDEC